MIQRVNLKIEKLIESFPTDSDQLPSHIKEPFCEGHSSDSESGHSSDSEPDPEEPTSPKVEKNEIDSLYEFSFEQLLATCSALLRENQGLKMELAAVKAERTMNEIDTRPNDAQSVAPEEEWQDRKRTPHQFSWEESWRVWEAQFRNEILTWSSSVKEVTSPAGVPHIDLALPIRSPTPMVSSSKGKCHERSQSMDVGSLSARHPVARAYANSEGVVSLPQSPELSLSACTPLEQSNASRVPHSVPQVDLAVPIRSPTPMVSSSKCKCHERSQSMDVGSLSARHPAARAYANSEGVVSLPQSPELSLSACTPLEQSNASRVPDPVMRYTSAPSVWKTGEYVQYHKEPMAGGWR